MRIRPARCLFAFLAATTLVGCMTKPPSRVHYVGPGFGPTIAATPHRGGTLRLSSLGAGSPLGRSIYQNDIYLAYMAEVSAPVRVTNVPTAP